jgi:hypothetical protein
METAMNFLAVILPVLALDPSAFALEKAAHKGINIESAMTYTAPGRDVKSSRTFVWTPKQKGWIPMAEAKEGIALIGRVEDQGSTLRIDDLLVDSNDSSGIVSIPAVVLKFGEKVQVKADSGQRHVVVNLMAKRVSFVDSN